MRIIPAIDIIGGRCVRLSEGDYNTEKVYYENPLDAAKQFEAAGLEYLHLVDLDGAKAKAVQNWEILETICKHTDLKVDFSGGIKTTEEVERAFSLGAAKVTIGSLCIKNPALVKSWLQQFGAEKIIIGADVKGEQIAIHGWLETAETTIFDFIEDYQSAGAKHFMCTDVAKDGKLQGPSLALYKKLLAAFPSIELIASGGVSGMQDLVALAASDCAAVIIGKAIYENRIELQDLKDFVDGKR